MFLDLTPVPDPVLSDGGGSSGPAVSPGRASLRLVPDVHPALAGQQEFAELAERVMRLAEVSGQRLATALYLVLRRHMPQPELDPEHGLHLRCAECHSADRDPAEQYPCPTAREACWALDAVLR